MIQFHILSKQTSAIRQTSFLPDRLLLMNGVLWPVDNLGHVGCTYILNYAKGSQKNLLAYNQRFTGTPLSYITISEAEV